MNYIVSGCVNYADNNIGIRLRRPGGTAIWAPDTAAFVCDVHVIQGFNIQITLIPNTSGTIETVVNSPGGVAVSRTTEIVQTA